MIANIKPVIHILKDGTIKVSSKAMSIRGGINSISKKLCACTPDKKYPIYVLYSNNRKNGDLLADALRKSGFDVPDKNIINIGATIGSHIGSNACGVAYISED